MTKADKEGQRKAPILRFKGFTNDWEQRKLENLSEHKGGTSIEKYFSSDGLYKVISIGSYGLNNEYIDQGIRAVKNKTTESKLVRSGQLTMVLNDKTANGNLIGRCLLISKDNEFIVNQRTEIIIPGPDLNENYAYYYLNGPFRNKVKKIAQGGTQIYVNYSSVKRQKINYPIKNEQIKISKLLKIIKSLITLYDRKLKLLSQVKKYFLDNLFAKKEYPNLRFKGFTDAWEQRKLLSNIENIIDYRGKTPKKLGLSWNGEREYPALSAINVENGKINLSKTEHFGDAYLFSKWMKKALKLGQVILTTEAPVGNVAQIKEKKHYILSQRVIAFETDKNLLDDFLYFLLQRNNSTLLRYSTGGTAKGISQKSLKQVKINLTPNISEQKQISQLLNVVKNLITLYENKQHHLTEIKRLF